MTCKDCCHYGICDLDRFSRGFEIIINAEICEGFKDKRTIIELPCKVGDTAYVIRRFHSVPKVQSGMISSLQITKEGQLYAEVKYVGRGVVGRKVFVTQNEAEKALDALK